MSQEAKFLVITDGGHSGVQMIHAWLLLFTLTSTQIFTILLFLRAQILSFY